jgi:hypothetical protein
MVNRSGIGEALSHGSPVHAERSEQRRCRVRWLQLEETDEDMLWAGVSVSSPHAPA